MNDKITRTGEKNYEYCKSTHRNQKNWIRNLNCSNKDL